MNLNEKDMKMDNNNTCKIICPVFFHEAGGPIAWKTDDYSKNIKVEMIISRDSTLMKAKCEVWLVF